MPHVLAAVIAIALSALLGRDASAQGTTCEDDLAACQAALATCPEELASCETARAECSADLAEAEAALAAATADEDGDGVRDQVDQCSGSQGAVDLAGCTIAQFCTAVNATSRPGKVACKKSDWRNDEPSMRRSDQDCTIDKGAKGTGDDRCVPTGGLPPTTSVPTTSTSSSTVSTTSTVPGSTTTTLASGACGTLSFTTGPPGGACGRVNGAADGSGANLVPFGSAEPVLACGSLYIGGGASVQPPSPTPDGATTVYNVTDCSDPTALVLGPASSTDTGNMTQCSAPGCFFGPPLPIPNPGAAAVSTCVINLIAASPPVGGTLNATTGESEVTLPLTVSVFVTGDLNGPAPGIQPCPICVGGECDLGPNAGGECTTTTSAGTTHDCPPPGSPLPSFGVDLSPLVTGSVLKTEAAGNFCAPSPGQATRGCFGTGIETCKYIEATGVPSGDLSAGGPLDTTLASVFCIPGSGSPLVDTVANLPGPGAVTLAGEAVLETTP
jgi:hypothetical protein